MSKNYRNTTEDGSLTEDGVLEPYIRARVHLCIYPIADSRVVGIFVGLANV